MAYFTPYTLIIVPNTDFFQLLRMEPTSFISRAISIFRFCFFFLPVYLRSVNVWIEHNHILLMNTICAIMRLCSSFWHFNCRTPHTTFHPYLLFWTYANHYLIKIEEHTLKLLSIWHKNFQSQSISGKSQFE